MGTSKTFIVFRFIFGAATLALTGVAHAQERPSIAGLQAQIADLQAAQATDSIPGLASYVTMDVSDPARPTLRVAGADLQVVNGSGSSSVNNGVGNFVIGYDTARTTGPSSCSISVTLGQIECFSSGGTWALNHKAGSHNLVIGDHHNYSGIGSLLAGYENNVPRNAPASAVLGGAGNATDAPYATVTGGASNFATGASSSVSGGTGRTAPLSNDWAAGGLFQPN